ncbi:MAG TPA: hypothetical protein VHE12_08590 [bacterium]|nr:hypothetical protein [bacterium]
MLRLKLGLPILFLFTSFFGSDSIVWSDPAPMEYFNSLVAGGFEAGYRDGAFQRARFNNPSGLAFDPEGERLFVADTDNSRVRVVLLDRKNEVQTLVGTGTSGNIDGPFDKANLNSPGRLVFAPPDRLVVYDRGSLHLRVLDLRARTVTTLPGDFRIWDLLYDSKTDCLYFTEPDQKDLIRLELKTSMAATILRDDPKIPSPMALAAGPDGLFVADRDGSMVFRMKWKDLPFPLATPVIPETFGQAHLVQEMAFSGGSLYALQIGEEPLVKIGDPTVPVTLATAWDFTIDNRNQGFEPFLAFTTNNPVGFIASPTEDRKFYLSKPFNHIVRNGVVSFKDYDFGPYWKSFTNSEPGTVVMDYLYPPQKPKNTFRILLAGDSRTYVGPRNVPGPPYDFNLTYQAFLGTFRNDTMGKQLEFFLNTEAALRGISTRFEVLEWNRKDRNLSSYAPYEIPPIVKRYGIDMVLALVSWSAYEDYFIHPMTAEGIPAEDVEPEYLLKPLAQRIPPGIAKDFYDRFLKSGGRITDKAAFPMDRDDQWTIYKNGDQTMKDDMTEMAGKRLEMMAQRYSSSPTLLGGSPKTVLFFVPYTPFPDSAVPFWQAVSDRYGFPFLDLSDGYQALRIGYYPDITQCCSGHYTAYGDRLIGYLLSHYLVEDKMIPFHPPAVRPKTDPSE